VSISNNNLKIAAFFLISVLLWILLGHLGVLDNDYYFSVSSEVSSQQSALGLWWTYSLSLVLTSLILFFMEWSRRNLLGGTLAIIGVFIVYTIFVYIAELLWLLSVPFVIPVGSTLTALCFSIFWHRLQSKDALQKSNQLLSSNISNRLGGTFTVPQASESLGGAEVELSILFSDIENFANIAHELTPNQLVELMNEYLDTMTNILHANDGVLDKYVGDAISSMFGAPEKNPRQAAQACKTALDMQVACADLREKWKNSGLWPASACCLRSRIGINTGFAIVGNFGSRSHFSYTMMGDSVNLASRCQYIAKEYGIYNVLTHACLQQALVHLPDLHYRKLDVINFKGRYDNLVLYELWDPTIDHVEAKHCKASYENAFEAYQAKDFETARQNFLKALRYEPYRAVSQKSPASVLLARTELYLREGAPVGWTGTHRIKFK
jgi:adenylate cyclase